MDVLGREVSMPVDDNKGMGNYSIQFNGSQLSSGIYFYRLIITPSNGEKSIVKQKAMQIIK
jgi:hypothetical protein